MGHKIFVSYKYHDSNVKKISSEYGVTDTVRTYVNKLAEYIDQYSDHIWKAEKEDEDLSELKEDTIAKKLSDRIYDSTLTIVMISPNMRDSSKADKEQWIPWEVEYSLKETSRKNMKGEPVTSSTNAVLAIVVPDKNNSYSYYINDNACCNGGCRTLKTDTLFEILRKNMFNEKAPNKRTCENNSVIYRGDSSYIQSVKWETFIKKPEFYINKAYELRDNIDKYNIRKEI